MGFGGPRRDVKDPDSAAYCGRCGVWVAPDVEFRDAASSGRVICEPTCPGPSRFEPKPKEKGKPW